MKAKARKLIYMVPNERAALGHTMGCWDLKEEPYSDERYRKVLLLKSFGAAKNVQVK